jgi:3-methyladenine DNA glycosylase AlkD
MRYNLLFIYILVLNTYTKKEKDNKHIKHTILEVMASQLSPYDYYVTMAEGWAAANESIQSEIDEKGYKEGDITNLPNEKKKEIFSTFGKSKDGRSKTTAYIINRGRHSEIISFEKIEDHEDESKTVGSRL